MAIAGKNTGENECAGPPQRLTLVAMKGGPQMADILVLLSAGRIEEAAAQLARLVDPSVADVITRLPRDFRVPAIRLLPPRRAAEVLRLCPEEVQADIVDGLDDEPLAALLDEIDPDERLKLLERVSGDRVDRLLSAVSAVTRQEIQATLSYPPDTVGRLMTPDFLTIQPDWTVAQALEHIRRHGNDAETLHTVYAVDPQGRLLDDVRLRQLVLAPPQQSVRGLMDGHVLALSATDDRERAVEMMDRYDRPVLPVVDARGKLVGIVTFDDVIDVAVEETTEDIQKLGGVEALDEPYMSTSIARLIRKRGAWLSALFLGEMLTASAMGHYEEEISRAVVLALFIPLIISSGGNSGSQASTLVIRALALRELKLRDWLRVLRREAVCGLFLGGWLGLIGLLRVNIWHWMGWVDYTPHYELVAVTVLVALVGVVLWGTLAGSMLPFLLYALRLDPAAISAPFVATTVDVTGLIIYFSVAAWILHGTLL